MVNLTRIDLGNARELQNLGFFEASEAEQMEVVYNFLTKKLGVYEFSAYGFQTCNGIFYILYRLRKPIPLIIQNKLIQTDGLPYIKVLFVRSSVGTLPAEQGYSFYQWYNQIKATREQLTEDLREK